MIEMFLFFAAGAAVGFLFSDKINNFLVKYKFWK